MKKLSTITKLIFVFWFSTMAIAFADPQTPIEFVYEVQSGDSLATILKQFVRLGQSITPDDPMVKEIFKQNPHIQNWRQLKSGTSIKLFIDNKKAEISKIEDYQSRKIETSANVATSEMSRWKSFKLKLSSLIQTAKTCCFGGISLASTIGTIGTSGETSPPKVNSNTAAVSFGVRLFRFMLVGVRSSYSRIDQTSAPTALTGSRTGTRMVPVSPLLGCDLKFASLLVDYQMIGDYQLSNPDMSGNQVMYKKPSGLGAELLFKISSLIGAGFRYEKVTFSQEQVGSGSAANLTDKINLRSFGVVVSFNF